MLEPSLTKLLVLTTATLLKRVQHKFFLVNFIQEHLFCRGSMNGCSETPARLFKNTPSFTEHLQWLILTFLGFQPATLLKRDSSIDVFLWILQNFYEHLLTGHLRMNASCVYLSILRNCSDDLFSIVLLRNLFQVQVTVQFRIQMYWRYCTLYYTLYCTLLLLLPVYSNCCQ